MNAGLPIYASAFTDRHGRQRVRFRRTGCSTAYALSAPGTAEFTQEYREWLDSAPPPIAANRANPGSFDDLIARFYRSAEWSSLKETTQATYRGEIERFRATYGERAVATMTAGHVASLMAKMAATPSAANNLKKRLGQLFQFAILIGLRRDNPARVVRAHRIRSGGHRTWGEAEIALYESTHAVGTKARLAFDLALYTLQRKSEVRIMGPQHVIGDKIRIRQLKTGKQLLIPIHPNLARSIAATECGHLTFVVSEWGAPFTDGGFGNWFRSQCDAAGLSGYSMHGLRKAGSRRLAEIGAANQIIKSFTGHSSDGEVARYTRDAEQSSMAETGLAMLLLANTPRA